MQLFQNELLRDKLYNYIKDKMNSGDLKPGDIINQKKLSEEIGIGRTPFRDCMIQLEAEGFVTIIPCKGVVVRSMSFEEIMDCQEIGGALEGRAAELAFNHVRKYSIEKLEAIVDEVCNNLDKGIVTKCYEKNEEFHTTILSGCHNRPIISMIINLRERLYDFPQLDLAPVLKWERTFWDEHRHIVDILRCGTAGELGDYFRKVHWSVEGKEEYWENLFNLPTGSVNQYITKRDEA